MNLNLAPYQAINYFLRLVYNSSSEPYIIRVQKAFKARIGEVGPVTAGCAMVILSSVAVISLPSLAKAFSKLSFTSMLFTTFIIAKIVWDIFSSALFNVKDVAVNVASAALVPLANQGTAGVPQILRIASQFVGPIALGVQVLGALQDQTENPLVNQQLIDTARAAQRVSTLILVWNMPSPVGPTLTAITLIEWTADYVPAEYMMPETRLALDLVRHMSTAVITTTSIQPYSPEIAMVSGGFLLILGAYEATHRYGKAKGYSICVVDFKEIVSNFICLDPEDRKRLLAAFRAYKEFQRQFQITSSSHRPRLESPRVSNRIEEVTETIQETANTIPVVTESEILPSAIAPSSAIPGPSVSWTGWKAQNPVKPFSDFNNEGIAKVQKKWKAPFSMMNVKKGNPPPETYNQLFTRSIQLPSNKLQGAANPQPSTTKLTGSFFSSASTRLLRPWVR